MKLCLKSYTSYIERRNKRDIQIAQAALKRVAERNGIPLEMVLESIQAAIEQSELNKLEIKKGKRLTPDEAVALLGDAVYEARRQKPFP